MSQVKVDFLGSRSASKVSPCTSQVLTLASSVWLGDVTGWRVDRSSVSSDFSKLQFSCQDTDDGDVALAWIGPEPVS